VWLACKTLEATQVARDAMKIVEREAQARFISIAFDDDGPLLAIGDRRAIRQVLVSLLSNAIKYNCEGGWIRLKVSGGPLTRIDIQDTSVDDDPSDMAPDVARHVRNGGSTSRLAP
jgi:signal transduction histidine kinase